MKTIDEIKQKALEEHIPIIMDDSLEVIKEILKPTLYQKKQVSYRILGRVCLHVMITCLHVDIGMSMQV